MQEALFNVVAAFLYITSSSYLSYAVTAFLKPLYIVTPFFQVYPAMTAAYVSSIPSITPSIFLFLNPLLLKKKN